MVGIFIDYMIWITELEATRNSAIIGLIMLD